MHVRLLCPAGGHSLLISAFLLAIFSILGASDAADDPKHCIGAPMDPNPPAIPADFWEQVQNECMRQNQLDKVDKYKSQLDGFRYSGGGWTVKAYTSFYKTRCSDRFGNKNKGPYGGDLGNIFQHCPGGQGAFNHQTGSKDHPNDGLSLLFYDPLSNAQLIPQQ